MLPVNSYRSRVEAPVQIFDSIVAGAATKVAPSPEGDYIHVNCVLRIKLLTPEIVEAVLAGKQPEGLTMAQAMQPFPAEGLINSGVADGPTVSSTRPP